MIHALILVLAFSRGFAIDNFNLGCLKSHNYYRGLHGSPTLVWSKELASDAQKWANALAKDGKFEHDLASMTNKQEGENLAYFGPPRPKCQGPKHDGCVECAEIVANWYNEITGYDFTNGKEKDPNTNIRHFAQIVWKGSKQLGVGTAISKKNNRFIIVARYKTGGNVGGPEGFKKNIFPLGTTSDATRNMSSPTNDSKPQAIAVTHVPVNPNAAASGQLLEPTMSNCRFYVVNTKGNTSKLIQKCPGKPDVTWVQEKVESSKLSSPSGPNALPEEDALALTNFYRSMHHATPVALNRTLSVDAQKWAEGLARGKKLIHQENNKDGENLAKMASGGKSLLKAINAWYDEMGDYNYKIGKFGANTGHFTQLVWNSTKELGLGIATTKDGLDTYVVARYRPAGNIIGHFKDNVFPSDVP